jgi:hypothetical protein
MSSYMTPKYHNTPEGLKGYATTFISPAPPVPPSSSNGTGYSPYHALQDLQRPPALPSPLPPLNHRGAPPPCGYHPCPFHSNHIYTHGLPPSSSLTSTIPATSTSTFSWLTEARAIINGYCTILSTHTTSQKAGERKVRVEDTCTPSCDNTLHRKPRGVLSALHVRSHTIPIRCIINFSLRQDRSSSPDIKVSFPINTLRRKLLDHCETESH